MVGEADLASLGTPAGLIGAASLTVSAFTARQKIACTGVRIDLAAYLDPSDPLAMAVKTFEAKIAPELPGLNAKLTVALRRSQNTTVNKLSAPAPALGCCRALSVSMAHKHIFGVLNTCVRGAKMWTFWAPHHKPNTAPDVELAQEAGQVVWIPPSWWHHVRTTGGDTILEGGNSGQGAPVEALHWATTLLPPQHIGDALAALGCVGAVDDYSDEAKTLPHKPSLYSALMAYRIAVQEE